MYNLPRTSLRQTYSANDLGHRSCIQDPQLACSILRSRSKYVQLVLVENVGQRYPSASPLASFRLTNEHSWAYHPGGMANILIGSFSSVLVMMSRTERVSTSTRYAQLNPTSHECTDVHSHEAVDLGSTAKCCIERARTHRATIDIPCILHTCHVQN